MKTKIACLVMSLSLAACGMQNSPMSCMETIAQEYIRYLASQANEKNEEDITFLHQAEKELSQQTHSDTLKILQDACNDKSDVTLQKKVHYVFFLDGFIGANHLVESCKESIGNEKVRLTSLQALKEACKQLPRDAQFLISKKS